MAKNYESESKNSKNYAGTSNKSTSEKNTSRNEMSRSENTRSGYETDTRDKSKNKTNDKTSQSYDSDKTSRY